MVKYIMAGYLFLNKIARMTIYWMTWIQMYDIFVIHLTLFICLYENCLNNAHGVPNICINRYNYIELLFVLNDDLPDIFK